MEDRERIAQWINVMLHEVSKLGADKGIELLHICGGECSKTSGLLEGASVIRNLYKQEEDLETLFEAFKTRYYNTSRFTKEGDKITLVFDECTCPMVKQGVSHSYLCNCTVGYSKKIFETLFGCPVKIKLIKSILNGDSTCKQEILVSDARQC